MANRHMIRCSASLIWGWCKLKPGYYLTPVGITITKKTKNNNVGKDMVKREPLCTFGGGVTTIENYTKLPQKMKIKLQYDPAIPLPTL